MTNTFISLKNIHISLSGPTGAVNIKKNVDFHADQGDTISITGPSGSGKSTMMLISAGLQKPSEGRVVIAEKDITDLDEDALARFRRGDGTRGRMGIVFQSFHLIPTMTALENVATPLELAGADDAFDRAAAAHETVGLGHRTGHYPAQMSGGEQQRVALARATAPNPSILLADEPTGNLDSANGAAIMDLLFALRDAHGSTLVLVTHDPVLAERCDRVVRLADGQLL